MQKKDFKDLSADKKLLVKKAKDATKLSYSPYSNFAVGAAIELNSGEIILGANQENASYPLSLCAERVALYNAAINFPKQKIKSLAINFDSSTKHKTDILTPCGACRQVIQEFEQRQKQKIEIIMVSKKQDVLIAKGIEELLPSAFTSLNLK